MGRLIIAVGALWVLILAAVGVTWFFFVRRPLVQMPEVMELVVAGWGVAVALVIAMIGVSLIRLGIRMRRRKRERQVRRAEKRAAREAARQAAREAEQAPGRSRFGFRATWRTERQEPAGR